MDDEGGKGNRGHLRNASDQQESLQMGPSHILPACTNTDACRVRV
jgi:hypothetical protein